MPVPRMHLMIALSVIGIALSVSWLRPSLMPPVTGYSPPPITRSHQFAKRQAVSKVVTLPIAREAEALNTPGRSATEDMAVLDLLLSRYRRHHEGNPVGSNEEITAALLGRNPPGIAYLPAEGSFLDARGHLIDRWGTPYFFHALSRDRMEIRSAGPDGMYWTPDDLVHQPGD